MKTELGGPVVNQAIHGHDLVYHLLGPATTSRERSCCTTPGGARYDAAAARLAWSRTIEFFDRALR